MGEKLPSLMDCAPFSRPIFDSLNPQKGHIRRHFCKGVHVNRSGQALATLLTAYIGYPRSLRNFVSWSGRRSRSAAGSISLREPVVASIFFFRPIISGHFSGELADGIRAVVSTPTMSATSKF